MTPQTGQSWGTFQLLTSPGPAAIAVVRVRGPLAGSFLREHIQTRSDIDPQQWTIGRVFRAELLDETGAVIDDMLVSVHAPAPSWDVRLHLHGSPGIVRCCLDLLKRRGLAEQTEDASTLWRNRNRIEAEAWALLPRMLTLRGVQWLVQQSRLLSETLQELASSADVEGARQTCREIIARRELVDWFARPLRVALVAPPNAGKSTLANALADQHVSLVSPVPGTTRDWLEIPGEIDGFPVLWLDTAGLRRGGDKLEIEGMQRTRRLIETADAVLLVLDASVPTACSSAGLIPEATSLNPTCVALNKCDLLESDAEARAALPASWGDVAVSISAVRRTGLPALTALLRQRVAREASLLSLPAAFTDRQAQALRAAASETEEGFRERVLACLGPHSEV